MPWEQSGTGYTKKRKKGDERSGGFVRNPKQYEKLRSKGMSKERASAITNSDNVGKSAFDIEKAVSGLEPKGPYDKQARKNRSIGGATGGAAVGAAMGASSHISRGGPISRGVTRVGRGGRGAAVGAVLGTSAAVAGHTHKLNQKYQDRAVDKSAFGVEKAFDKTKGKSKGGLMGVKKPGLTHRGAYVHTRDKGLTKSAFGL